MAITTANSPIKQIIISTIPQLVTIFTLLRFPSTQAQCVIPQMYQKSLYALEDGMDTFTYIKESTLESSTLKFNGTCEKILELDTGIKNSKNDIVIMFKNDTNSCYFCYHLISRSVQVLQYRHTQCSLAPSDRPLDSVCDAQKGIEFETGFVTTFNENSLFNCKSIIEGYYNFNYRYRELTGMCSSSQSYIKACQRQGSPLRDNMVFYMGFGYCPSAQPVATIYYGTYNFYCLARWVDESGNIWAALQYDTNDIKFKYRCWMTRLDQQNTYNMQQWGITVDANCKTLKTFFDAPIRMEVYPALDPGDHIPFIQPGCKLPSNFSGSWFYPSEYHTMVRINTTHIHYRRKYDQYRYEDIYFVCRQSRDTRYLMATVTAGRCDMDYVCFQFLPRHQSIIRFRMARPFRRLVDPSTRDYIESSHHQAMIFIESCAWSSFTLNNLNWVYEYYVLDPPLPVNCPLQGRYMFQQWGQSMEQYYTKGIVTGGVTPRPRVQVVCPNKWQSDLNACVSNPKELRLDAARCMRFDYTGRPISEYDWPDNILTCVGFWMEDTVSYLITHDPLDPVVGNFRCWVYRRIGFHAFTMSRSINGQCGRNQTPFSQTLEEGASLRLEIVENELEFDDCPMQYDDGRNPYGNPHEVAVLSTGCRLAGVVKLMHIYLLFSFLLITSVRFERLLM